MRQTKFWFTISGMLAAFALALMVPEGALAGSQYKVLHRFTGSHDGAGPIADLIFDGAGNLYGATVGGGASGAGTVFKLKANSDGSWTESVLYSFTDTPDGANPSAGLVFDISGKILYGTTVAGGTFRKCGSGGCGTVFKLTENADGSWSEAVLHSFNVSDGFNPSADLILDATGKLYGTTVGGGNLSYCNGAGCGAVFRLKPNSDGSWTEAVLHSFNGTDGLQPWAPVIFNTAGNLYGTTLFGGAYGFGVVFELKPSSHGSWTETVLHSFNANDNGGSSPKAGLIFDNTGNLYGTTVGDTQHGNVFELKPKSGGGWTKRVLYGFRGGRDGGSPVAPVVFDAAGNLYGTTYQGGDFHCSGFGCGTAFRLSPNANGSWSEHVVHDFHGAPAQDPNSGLVLDKVGNLYGTTFECGMGYNCQGTVFEITP